MGQRPQKEPAVTDRAALIIGLIAGGLIAIKLLPALLAGFLIVLGIVFVEQMLGGG